MWISEVATRSGVPATTLRYYESIGLVTPDREQNGYRVYGAGVLERLELIEMAKQLNLSLPEIAEMLDVVESETCTQVREALRPVLEQRLREVDQRLASLQVLRDRLDAATRRVAACPDSGASCRTECVLLDNSVCAPTSRSAQSSALAAVAAAGEVR